MWILRALYYPWKGLKQYNKLGLLAEVKGGGVDGPTQLYGYGYISEKLNILSSNWNYICGFYFI